MIASISKFSSILSSKKEKKPASYWKKDTFASQKIINHSQEFFEHLVKFLQCRNGMKAKWDSLSTNRIEKIPNIDKISPRKDERDPIFRQLNVNGMDAVRNLEDLYFAAVLARSHFQETINKMIYTLMATNRQLGMKLSFCKYAELKSEKRASVKALNDYTDTSPGPPFSWLFDIVRGSLVCETEDQLIAAVNYLKENVTITRLKNRFREPTVGGYRDINMNIRLQVSAVSSSGEPCEFFHTCELQLHLKEMKELDEELQSHSLYEYFRLYFKDSNASIKARILLLERIVGESVLTIKPLEEFVEDILRTELTNRDILLSLSHFLDFMGERALELKVRERIMSVTIRDFGENHIESIHSIGSLGQALKNVGRTEEAKQYQLKALCTYEKLLGKKHSFTLSAAVNLSALLKANDDLLKAKKMYQRVLKYHRDKSTKGNSQDALVAEGNLVGVLEKMGDFVSAKAHCEKVLEGYMNALPPDHPDTLAVVGNLASLLAGMNDFRGAKEKYQQALTGQEKVFGPNHPETLATVCNMAVLEMKLDNFVRAKELYLQALNGQLNSLGSRNVETLRTMGNLAILYAGTNELEKARELYEEALFGQEAVLGPNHTETLATLNNLAGLLHSLNDKPAASALYERALTGLVKKLGPHHVDTLRTLSNLAILQKDMDELPLARNLLVQALRGQEKVLGLSHTDTLDTATNLAGVLGEMGETEKALKMYQRALSIQENVLGPNHTDTLRSVMNIASLLKDKDSYSAARQMYQRALDGQERVLGSTHKETLTTLFNIAGLCVLVKDFDWAREYFDRAITGQELTLGLQHPDTLRSMEGLAVMYKELKEFDQARQMFEKVLQAQEQVLGVGHSDTLRTVEHMAELLADLHDHANARMMYERAVHGFSHILGMDRNVTAFAEKSMRENDILELQHQHSTNDPYHHHDGPHHRHIMGVKESIENTLKQHEARVGASKLAQVKILAKLSMSLKLKRANDAKSAMAASDTSASALASGAGKDGADDWGDGALEDIQATIIGVKGAEAISEAASLRDVYAELGDWESARKLYERSTAAYEAAVKTKKHPHILWKKPPLAVVVEGAGFAFTDRELLDYIQSGASVAAPGDDSVSMTDSTVVSALGGSVAPSAASSRWFVVDDDTSSACCVPAGTYASHSYVIYTRDLPQPKPTTSKGKSGTSSGSDSGGSIVRHQQLRALPHAHHRGESRIHRLLQFQSSQDGDADCFSDLLGEDGGERGLPTPMSIAASSSVQSLVSTLGMPLVDLTKGLSTKSQRRRRTGSSTVAAAGKRGERHVLPTCQPALALMRSSYDSETLSKLSDTKRSLAGASSRGRLLVDEHSGPERGAGKGREAFCGESLFPPLHSPIKIGLSLGQSGLQASTNSLFDEGKRRGGSVRSGASVSDEEIYNYSYSGSNIGQGGALW